jgi:hypothetical protein
VDQANHAGGHGAADDGLAIRLEGAVRQVHASIEELAGHAFSLPFQDTRRVEPAWSRPVFPVDGSRQIPRGRAAAIKAPLPAVEGLAAAGVVQGSSGRGGPPSLPVYNDAAIARPTK